MENIEVEWIEGERVIHLIGPIVEFSLCGDDIVQDGVNGDNKIIGTTIEPVNCPLCIEIIEFCKKVKKNQYKK